METKAPYDVVISNGRVMDPETGLDDVRNIGITDGTIQAVDSGHLEGRAAIDAGGCVVSPGFIDLHSHGQDHENYAVQARDGVTTALELETGDYDVAGWYTERDGKALINYGAGVGHIAVRKNVMKDASVDLPVADAAYRGASEAETMEIRRQIERGLEQGWQGEGFDDSGWLEIRTDGPWEKQAVGREWAEAHGGGSYDGLAWYRVGFEVEGGEGEQGYQLAFGAVDEACKVWVNGELVLDRRYPHQGDRDSWTKAFAVEVTEQLHFDRVNVVAVRVEDAAGAGGIWRPVRLIRMGD